ncbi:hypothetical protein [Priestia aryabhattai]|uniref:hypothetical protein n=1 Tax=Priestia aryabhattai TaxID=412384 RepID=UPI0027E4D85A|nr:hypothetical protein [Priestia aryabhattai]MCG0050792.1 hypothetical protein [Priestia aryabhattai]
MISIDSFISTIIFTLPGLLCYYWLQWLGFVPSQKHTPFEMLGISALLWLPVSTLTLLFYNFVLYSKGLFLKSMGEYRTIDYVLNLKELQSSFTNLQFVLVFSILSLVFSYLVARFWVQGLFPVFLKHINFIRKEKIKISQLSSKPTVWEEIFITAEEKVVKIVKLDKPEESIIGAIRKASRPLEPDRNITLDEIDYFTKLVEKYNPLIKNVFIDTKAGIAIYLYHPKYIKNAQHKDNASPTPIISPSVSE